jgi:hypothetical protein
MTGDGCDCTELCSMGPTCPGGILARLPGSGCAHAQNPGLVEALEEILHAREVDLFGDPAPDPIDPVPGDPHNAHLKPKRRRRTDIVADRITAGRHPLTNGPLHPEASRDRDNTSSGDDPFTCGTCVFRQPVGRHTRSYPKCLLPTPGVPNEPPPPPGRFDHETQQAMGRLDQYRAYQTWYAARYPRVSHSDATDVRAWWPACPAYEPLWEKTL